MSQQLSQVALTVDCVVFGFDGNGLKVLLTNRLEEPYKGMLAIPGGFLESEETLSQCASRVLFEKTGIMLSNFREAGTLSKVNRDPRARVLSIVFYALMNSAEMFSEKLIPLGETSNYMWVDYNELLSKDRLAFDHSEAVKMAYSSVADKLNREPLAFELLNKEFTIKELQTVYELLLNRSFDRANFHKKMVGDSSLKIDSKKSGRKKNTGILTDTGKVMKETKHKPAKFYTFDSIKYNELMEKEDFNFGF